MDAMYCIVLYLSISTVLLTARAFQKRSRPHQLTLCRSLHAEALQATTNERLAQGPSVAPSEYSNRLPSGRKASTLPMRHHAQRNYDVCWRGSRMYLIHEQKDFESDTGSD